MPRTYGGTSKKRSVKNTPNTKFNNRQKKLELVRRFSAQKSGKKHKLLFALDTNILMKKPMSLFGFHEHNIIITWQVLAELDNNKKGRSERARNARTAINLLSYLVERVPADTDFSKGIPLVSPADINGGRSHKRGRLFFTVPNKSDVKKVLDKSNPDHRILIECIDQMEKGADGKNLILVSKDRMMRIWAHLVGVPVEDYGDDAIDIDNIRSTGIHKLSLNFWKKQGLVFSEVKSKLHKLTGKELGGVSVNEFLRINTEGGADSLHMVVKRKTTDNIVYAKRVTDYLDKNKIFGVNARSMEQNFAINALLDPNIKLVILEGPAGSGKTFITLAAAYHQIFCLKKERYSRVIATREVAPVGREVGFKPGNESEKMKSWMGAVTDNIRQIVSINEGVAGRGKKRLLERLDLREVNSMRGRSFRKEFVILEEAQNSPREQFKMLLTRGSDECKFVVVGNFTQTDIELSVRDSGLARLIDVSRNSEYVAHIVLPGGERGGFCNFIETTL